MDKHQLIVRKTARYVTLGHLNKDTRRIWFVLHGYGQLAEYFISKFDVLDDGHTCVVAPEGLSRFYLNGMGGSNKVGATWMTREDRLNEIDDYLHYLNTLYQFLLGKEENQVAQIGLLGFSQGTATACRWMASGKLRFDKLVLWAGSIPDDLTDCPYWERLKDVERVFVYGKQDPLVSQHELKEQLAKFDQLGFSVPVKSFEGKHEVLREVVWEVCGKQTS
jgi:predicted esterase